MLRNAEISAAGQAAFRSYPPRSGGPTHKTRPTGRLPGSAPCAVRLILTLPSRHPPDRARLMLRDADKGFLLRAIDLSRSALQVRGTVRSLPLSFWTGRKSAAGRTGSSSCSTPPPTPRSWRCGTPPRRCGSTCCLAACSTAAASPVRCAWRRATGHVCPESYSARRAPRQLNTASRTSTSTAN